jgi:DNA-directed RNA polymerase subunit beta
MLALGSSLIPFLEHNDANRALMGSNMQRQALCLTKNEKCIVGTGLEQLVAHISDSNLISKNSGIIVYSSTKKIIVHKIKIICNQNKKLFDKKTKKNINYTKFTKRIYFLKKDKYSNQNTFLYQKNIVSVKSWIKKGQIIGESLGTKQGNLTIGKNILIAYLPWKGYNFEDAIVISEKLVKKNYFTSIHIKKYKIFLIENETGEV